MSLTRPIPAKMRDEMDADPFYHECCVTGLPASSWTKIEWHHAFTWAGQRVNEKWCIVPLAKAIHDRVHEPAIAKTVERIILNRADEETLRRYSKATNLISRRDQLNKEYANQKNQAVLSADTIEDFPA
jgi:hypothetical protein